VFWAKYHVVFCPKYRRAVLSELVAERLEEIVREVCAPTRGEGGWPPA
jgi:REP element-mobilizing transposase RayT